MCNDNTPQFANTAEAFIAVCIWKGSEIAPRAQPKEKTQMTSKLTKSTGKLDVDI